ncbi:MAG TPA: T9SS type A sorting domain-containing protein [Saprospiraceae bacterium]|nr:T9SS type A sorting domain-containing protein [Saprospiraceae bacterium]
MTHLYLSCKRFTVSVLLIVFIQVASFATTYTMKCVDFLPVNWSNPESWEPYGIPGPGDDVFINCPASAFVTSDVAITIKSLTVDKIGYFFGDATLTITERLETRYPFYWQMKLIIGPNATGIMTDELGGPNIQYITFYEDLVVNGNLTFESRGVSGKNITVNGSITQKEGDINANLLINQNGVVNLDSPLYPVNMSNINNKGTFNWINGIITSSYGSFNNEGVINVTSSNASIANGGWFSEYQINNIGTINIGANVDSLSILTKLVSTGDINMIGESRLNIGVIDLSGAINGPTGSSFHLKGLSYNPESFLQNGSSINVSSFVTYPSQIINISPNSDISQIDDFLFVGGTLNIETALPSEANYVLSSIINTSVDQSFTGNFILDGGSINGNVTILFNTPDLIINFGYFGGNSKVRLSESTILDLGQLGVSELINDGLINIRQDGYLAGGVQGIVNNGTINTNGDAVTMYGYNTNDNTGLIDNKGIMNINTKKVIVYAKLVNTGTINIGSNDTLNVFGEMQQSGLVTGQSSSKLSLGYSINDHTFNMGSITRNLGELEIYYGTTILKSGAAIENIVEVNAISGNLQSFITLPPTFKYYFKDSKVRINTQFEPTQLFEIEDTDIEGSGNIRINNAFNWYGGTVDVPLRINEGAIVSVRENVKRPIISSPFTNTGDITLSGGIIEINTAFFKNGGNWNIDSDEDVIIDGYTSFTNQGTFSICGDQPIKLIFNVPFVNEASGTFKGQGSYTFNAGFTNEGAVAPGCSPGKLIIEDNVESLKIIEIEVEGQEEGRFDELIVNGDMKAGDLLKVIVPTGTIVNGSLKIIHTTGNFTGQFTKVEMPSNFALEYLTDGVILSSNGTVGTSDQDAFNYGISVNPTLVHTDVNLTSSKLLPNASQIQLYDMQGVLVLSQICHKDQQNHNLNLLTIPNGVYVVKINTLPSWNAKIVVVH